MLLRKQDNGARLVGQCEISHPVPAPSTVEAPVRSEPQGDIPFSPADGMGETVARKSNAMFEADSKDGQYERLSARIHRMYKTETTSNSI